MRHRITVLCVLAWLVAVPAVVAAPVPQASEEDLARAFQMLGEILGLPEIPPEDLQRRVEEIGGLRFMGTVPIDFMTRAELAVYIQRLFEEEYPADIAEREERMLRAFGFLTAGEDLRAIREQVLNENIAGFYDERPEVKKLVAISSSSGKSLDLMNQLILSHELRHALQDQHVNLRQLLGEGTDYDDRRLAALSLLEGDATLLMEQYLAAGMPGGAQGNALAGLFGWSSGDGRAMAEMFAGPELRGAPLVVREQLLVPYLEGRSLALKIFERGGFRLLNERLADPPRSMEQVLHPEKYLDGRDEPRELNVPEAIGEPVESEGRLGEFLIRVLFQPVIARQEAERAAAGWGGDWYALWPSDVDDGAYRLVWHTTWDTEQEAREFYESLARFASVRYGSGVVSPAVEDTLTVEDDDGGWSRVYRRGLDVTLERDGLLLGD